MRRLLVVALAAGLGTACGGGEGPTNYAGDFVGTWDGSSRENIYGPSSGAPTALVHIASGGVNALVVQDLCGDGSGPSGTATSATSVTLAEHTCRPVRVGTCAAATFSIDPGGTASIANGNLTVDVTGSLTGCDQTRPVYWTFTGVRTSTVPPPPPPPPFSPPPGGACTTYQGNARIYTSADWNALVDGGCTAITGDLTISTVDVTGPLSAPALRSVGGVLYLGDNLQLTSISFPALTTGGYVQVYGNPQLTSVSFPALTGVVFQLTAGRNPVLTSLELPALTTSGSFLSVYGNPQLTSFSAPALTTVGTLDFEQNALLTSISLPALTTVDNYLAVTDHALLPLLSIPLLTSIGDDLNLERNARLASIALPALRTLGDLLFIRDNPVLPECMALAVQDQIISAYRSSDISGNDTAATCTP